MASTFSIFFATRNLPKRNGTSPWSAKTPQWPQISILVIASISLALSLFIMYSYWKGGHSKAEKVALHATIFAGAVFIFTIAMWSIGIGIMQGSRGANNDQDLWGWSCKDNTRRKYFEDSINYSLVCRQQDWVVVCAIIEISVEFLAICVYIFAFYRLFYTKRKLRKSMNVRDEARSSLWLAKLKEQKDVEEGDTDKETHRNTTYNVNQFHDPDEGRTVPILQPAPVARNAKGQSGESTITPLSNKRMPPKTLTRLNLANPPPTTPRSALAKLNANSEIPPTPRSVSFLPPPRAPGSRGSDKS